MKRVVLAIVVVLGALSLGACSLRHGSVSYHYGESYPAHHGYRDYGGHRGGHHGYYYGRHHGGHGYHGRHRGHYGGHHGNYGGRGGHGRH